MLVKISTIWIKEGNEDKEYLLLNADDFEASETILDTQDIAGITKTPENDLILDMTYGVSYRMKYNGKLWNLITKDAKTLNDAIPAVNNNISFE